jgi:CspA family cold shock protein
LEFLKETKGKVVMSKGKVKSFNEEGAGLITTEEEKEVFFYVFSIISEGYKKLSEGDSVVFDIIGGVKGDQAINITKVEPGKEAPRGSNPSKGKEDTNKRIEPQVQ